MVFKLTSWLYYVTAYSVMDSGHGGAVLSGEVTFDPCLASLHTYLGGKLHVYWQFQILYMGSALLNY